MKPKKIVLTGGPSTGKSSLINELKSREFICYEEISRQITLEARKYGIEQLFLTQPQLFSKKLLEGRTMQFKEASDKNSEVVFFDRGIPDVLAYMDYIGGNYPKIFEDSCQKYRYDQVFILEPWKTIYKTDNERYETFEQAQNIHQNLVLTYERFGYSVKKIPFLNIVERTDFVLDTLDL